MAKLQDMARRAVIRLRGPVIALRKAGRNLINGLHREGINLSQAQLSGCALAHARPPAALDAGAKGLGQAVRSAPVLRIGTLASWWSPLGLLPWHRSDRFPQFHMRARIRLAPPLRRSPSAPYPGVRRTDPRGSRSLWF